MKKELTKEQLFDHFSGRSSVLSKHDIRTWLQNQTNEERYYQWLEEWERQHTHWQTDTELEFSSLKERIKYHTTTDIIATIKPLWRQVWAQAMAASVAILLVSGYVFQDFIKYQKYATTFGHIENIKLSDGTNITLNANSTLRVPRFGFGTDTREVLLDGEAYFSVKHTADNQKFVVKTAQNFSVEVLGTEFSVRRRTRGTQVVLDKGSIKLHYEKNKQAKDLMMTPGDLVVQDKKGEVILKTITQPEIHSAWTQHRFVFDKTPMTEVVMILEEIYGLKIIINDRQLLEKQLSGEIEAHNADEILDALSQIFQLHILRTDNEIILSN